MTEDLIPASRIEIDGGTQSRAIVEIDVVDEYAAAMANGAKFPPVVVFYDGERYWLADGFHRYEAYLEGGRRDIPSDVRQGTRRDAILFSVGANSAHGLRRSIADKRRAVETLLRDEEWGAKPLRWIARTAGVSDGTVRNHKAKLSAQLAQIERSRTVEVERNGTTYEMKTAAIGGAPKRPEDPTGPPVASQSENLDDDEPLFDAASGDTDGSPEPDRELSQWFTPDEVAEVVAYLALLGDPKTLLEPAVGNGALLHAIDPERTLDVLACDVDERWVDTVRSEGWPCEIVDYLEAEPPSKRFDVAALNPPFELGQDGLFVAKGMDESNVVVAVLRTNALHGLERHELVWGRSDFGLTHLRLFRRRPSFSGGGSPRHEFCVVRLERGYEGPTDVGWI